MKKRKSAPKTLPKPVRWYAPDQRALDRLVTLGASKAAIYQGWKGQTPDKIRMRQGEVLGVVDGLRAFGLKRAVRAAVENIHKFGATIFDHDTGQNSRDDLLAMYEAATSPRQKLTETEKLARADARRKKSGQMLTRDAYEVWKGPGTVEQKAHATGWSPSALNAKFGPSGAPAGRPPKKVK